MFVKLFLFRYLCARKILILMPQITIYTDGSSLGNPGAGGYGVVLISPPSRRLSGRHPRGIVCDLG